MTARTRRLAYTVVILVALGTVALAYSYFIEPSRLVINAQTISIKGLDPAFDGLKIVAISDIHGGSNGADAASLRRVVELVNDQEADVIVLLGDYVSEAGVGEPVASGPLKMPMNEIADNLSGFRARYGVFAVLGNHDGFYGDDIVAAELERVGYRVLRNQVATIERSGKRLRFLGLNDHMKLNSWYTFDSDVRKVMHNDGGNGSVIVLEHSPDIHFILNYFKTLGEDYKLMIAGHTHGGQVWLPVVGRPIVPNSYGQKYAAGHVYDGGKDMFITTGVGSSILPFRFMVPPEVAVLTLHADPALPQ